MCKTISFYFSLIKNIALPYTKVAMSNYSSSKDLLWFAMMSSSLSKLDLDSFRK
jgi:hypothetical protein